MHATNTWNMGLEFSTHCASENHCSTGEFSCGYLKWEPRLEAGYYVFFIKPIGEKKISFYWLSDLNY